jgi:hypothetical protein
MRWTKVFDKSKINFVTDGIMFLCMMAIGGLGFLMKYVMPPGKERLAKYGNVDLSFLGMDRHEWGTIHVYLAFFLLATLALHIVLHWKMIVTLFNKLIPSQSARWTVLPAFVIVSGALILWPFLVKPTMEEAGRRGGRGALNYSFLYSEDENLGSCGGCDEVGCSPAEARGGGAKEISSDTTLAEICAQYAIPPCFLKKSLGLPETAPNDATLAELQNTKGFQLSDVQRILASRSGLRSQKGLRPE